MNVPLLLLLAAADPAAPRVDAIRPGILYAAAFGADYSTSRAFIGPHFREGNPLARAITLEGAAAARIGACLALDLHLQRRVQPRKLKVLRVGCALSGFVPAAWNVWTYHRHRGRTPQR